MARMDWEKLLNDSGVYHHETHRKDRKNERNQYLKDYDRLIFSPSFRRLGRKTQVHPLAKNDHVHTRLTHSLEVASVGRSLGCRVGEFVRETDVVPCGIEASDFGAIVQAACLAHDIGNPPFGHAGEYAIRHWFASNENLLNECLDERQLTDLKNFEGNAQGFRVVTQIENHYLDGGLRLSAATLATLIKYPWFSSSEEAKGKGKFNIFLSEEPIYRELVQRVGLIENSEGRYCRHPLSFLMEAADDICYRILDIEDALEIGVIRFEDVSLILEEIIGEQISVESHRKASIRRRIMPYRAAAISKIIEGASIGFVKNYSAIMRGKFDNDLIGVIDESTASGLDKLASITHEVIFNDQRKLELEIGAYSVISVILAALVGAVNEMKSRQSLSFRSDRILRLMGGSQPFEEDSYYECYMKVADYVSGMTDDYSTYIAGQISGNAK